MPYSSVHPLFFFTHSPSLLLKSDQYRYPARIQKTELLPSGKNAGCVQPRHCLLKKHVPEISRQADPKFPLDIPPILHQKPSSRAVGL